MTTTVTKAVAIGASKAAIVEVNGKRCTVANNRGIWFVTRATEARLTSDERDAAVAAAVLAFAG